jgi:predicted RNA-binding protein YlqC (UPF0109 family)
MLERVLEYILRSIVEVPGEVVIQTRHFGAIEKMQITVSKEDIPRVIGRSGRTIKALRVLLNSISGGKRVSLIIND